MAYSGEGIQVAQLVLEKSFGLDVNVLMQQRVFEKFGMRRTSMLWREDFRPNFARGFDEQGNNLGPNERQSVRAAGSMDTTVSDFAAFLAGVLRGDGLSQANRAEMLAAQVKIRQARGASYLATADRGIARGIAGGRRWDRDLIWPLARFNRRALVLA